MKLLKVLLAFLAIATLATCGDDDDDTPAAAATKSDAHCNLGVVSTYKMCHTFSQWTETGLAQAKTDCESASELGAAGTYSATDACDTLNECGRCAWAAGSDTIYTYYYKVTNSVNQEECQNTESESHCGSSWSGTWLAKGSY